MKPTIAPAIRPGQLVSPPSASEPANNSAPAMPQKIGYEGAASIALPPGRITSLLPERSMIQKAMKSAARIPMKIQLSIQAQSVPVKSTPASSCAITPVVITARKGRAPVVVASPAPCPMSVNALMAEWCGRYAPGRDDDTSHALDDARP